MPKKYKPFPDFLYASISAPSKGVSPTATFRPASSVSTDSAWGSATKPRDEKPKKKILITHDTLDCYPLSDVYALSLYLAQNGFDIFVWGPDQNLFQLRPENPAQEAISALESATSFHPKSDYTRCAQVGLAHDQLAVLDAENSIALFQHIHQGELPYGPATQISDFSFIQGYTGEFNHPDLFQHFEANPLLLDDMPIETTQRLLENSFEFVQYFMKKKPDLLKIMDMHFLVKIAARHYEFAQKLINTHELLEKLNENHLRILGEAHIEIARMLLGTGKLLEKLIANSSLFFIIEAHSSSPSFSAYAYHIIKKASIFKQFLAYILPHYLTQAIRREAAKQNCPDLMSMWCGQGIGIDAGYETAAELLEKIRVGMCT